MKNRASKISRNSKVGLALGSGSFRGFAHLGVIKILQQNDIHIDYVAGSSAGAIVGAYYALHGEVNSLEKIALSIKRRDLIKLVDITKPRRALIAGNKIKKFIDKLYHSKSFSDTKIPLRIVSADLITGEIVALKQGKLADAVIASISAPGIFPPVELQDKLLVDGGVVNPTPVNVVKDMGADLVVGVDLTLASKVNIKNPNIVDTLLRSLDLIRTRATRYNIESVNKNLILIRPTINSSFNLLKQFSDTKNYIRAGESEAKANIHKIKSRIRT